MRTLSVAFVRSASLGGLLIRFREPFGRWSHAAIVTPDNTVIEARSDKGVIERPLSEFNARYDRKEVRDLACADPDAGIAWARSQVGKRYDYFAVFGLAFRRSWQSDDRWHCMELVEMALIKSGRQRFLDKTHHITPNLGYMVV